MCYTRVKHHLNTSIVERIHHTGKYCDERFLCYNGDKSINFLSIFSELNCFAYAQIHVRVAYLFLYLVQINKEHVEKKLAEKISTFDKTIELLKITSTLLKNFKSKAPYRCVFKQTTEM